MFQYLEFKVSCVFEMQVMSCFFAELNEGPNFVMSGLLQSQSFQWDQTFCGNQR